MSLKLSFGPAAAPIDYGSDTVMHDPRDETEILLRAPIAFMKTIKSNTYVIEGSGGNVQALLGLQLYTKNDAVNFFEVKNANHFDLLYPINQHIAEKILHSIDSPLVLTQEGVQAAFDE